MAARYTILTFSPVQGFIEKSRKLRDLYGSSFLLSYLAYSLCQLAESQTEVVAPALPNVTQGVPNQIIIKGDLSKAEAQAHFHSAWAFIVNTCREEIERKVKRDDYHWQRAWDHWKNHCWEFFWAQSSADGSISEARQRMNEVKRSRDWTGINWTGESSTLSGTDAIAWPGMLDRTHPKPSRNHQSAQSIKSDIDSFYEAMSHAWGQGFLDEDERLSIPELIKRLITHPQIAQTINQKGQDFPIIERLENFTELNRHDQEQWTAWFQGDGDSIGKFLRHQSQATQSATTEENVLKSFSQAMIDWGEQFQSSFTQNGLGRIIYAGGDDFLGVLYPGDSSQALTLQGCLEQWIYKFPNEWSQHSQPITASVGFVWAAHRVPQRDILQHCKLAEQTAKRKGRDRITIRVLFNGGNYLDWTCPWRFIKPILNAYRDREGRMQQPNWNHLNEDVQALEARHAFVGDSSRIAQELFDIYFPDCEVRKFIVNSDYWFNPELTFDSGKPFQSGILGNQDRSRSAHQQFNQWFISLAQIGVHLFKRQPAMASSR